MAYTSSMPFLNPKWSLVDNALKEEIFNRAKEVGAFAAAKEYYQRCDMTEGALYKNLFKQLKRIDPVTGEERIQPIEPEKKVKKDEGRKLTKKEKEFIKRLENGEASIIETSRLIAKHVFTNMLKNPDQFKFYTFYQSSILELKKEEIKLGDQRMRELVNRLFAGKLPPTSCPKCGEYLYGERVVLEAQTVEEEANVQFPVI